MISFAQGVKSLKDMQESLFFCLCTSKLKGQKILRMRKFLSTRIPSVDTAFLGFQIEERA